MEAQGDEGTVRHRRKFVVLGTALPAASEARHSGHRLAPTGKGLPTRLPRSGLVQAELSGARRVFGRMGGVAPPKFAGSPSPARHEGKAAPTHTAYWHGGLSSSQIYHLGRPGGARSIRGKGVTGDQSARRKGKPFHSTPPANPFIPALPHQRRSAGLIHVVAG